MSWLNDLAAMYATEGVGTLGVDMSASTMFEIPRLESGSLLSMIETGGSSPQFIQNLTRKPAYTSPSAMIMVRAVDYPTARARAQAAYDVSTHANETINGVFYRKIRPVGDMLDQKPDVRGNARVSFNILGDRRA